MTEEERSEAILKAIKDKKAEIKARKEAEIKEGFLNPFGEGTSYDDVNDQLAKSKKTISEYCKGKLTDEEIKWLQNELEILK